MTAYAINDLSDFSLKSEANLQPNTYITANACV